MRARAIAEWARKWPWLKGYLKTNALMDEAEQATIDTSYSGEVVERYIDGSRRMRGTFAMAVMLPWSEGYDEVNDEASDVCEDWLEWVRDNQPEELDGREVVSMEPDYAFPAQDQVYTQERLARYALTIDVEYIDKRGAGNGQTDEG